MKQSLHGFRQPRIIFMAGLAITLITGLLQWPDAHMTESRFAAPLPLMRSLVFSLMMLMLALHLWHSGRTTTRPRSGTRLLMFLLAVLIVSAPLTLDYKLDQAFPAQAFWIDFFHQSLELGAAAGFAWIMLREKSAELTELDGGFVNIIALNILIVTGLFIFDFISHRHPEASMGENPLTDLSQQLAILYVLTSLLFTTVLSQVDEKVLGLARVRLFHRLENLPLTGHAVILANDLAYRAWRMVNRGKSFHDFYVWQISRKLDKGRAHKTLGIKKFTHDTGLGKAPEHSSDSFRENRAEVVDFIFSQGLRPDQRVLDYGCGSLRLGQHFIRFLDPGNFFGADVTDRFYIEGLKVLHQEAREKKPVLFIIGSPLAQNTKNRHMDYVFSNAVLKHVPKEELAAYLDDLCDYVDRKTTLLITFVFADRHARILGKSWAYPRDFIIREIQTRCPHHHVRVDVIKGAQMQIGVETRYGLLIAQPANEQD